MLTLKVVGVEGGREPACSEFPSAFVVSIVPTQRQFTLVTMFLSASSSCSRFYIFIFLLCPRYFFFFHNLVKMEQFYSFWNNLSPFSLSRLSSFFSLSSFSSLSSLSSLLSPLSLSSLSSSQAFQAFTL